MISVKNVTKSIDGHLILQDISLNITRGSIVGLVGRNGAGKTTLLRTMMGILNPDTGNIEFDGKQIDIHPEVKQHMLYVPDSTEMLNSYHADEYAALYAAIYPKFDWTYYRELMERFNLPARKKIQNFSKGMKALQALIFAFSARVSLIMLDEPTNGLDPIIKKQFLTYLIEEVSESGTTVLISSHHLEELERISDTIILLKNGMIEVITTTEDAKCSFQKLQLVFNGPVPVDLFEQSNVRVLSKVGRVYTVLIEDSTSTTVDSFKQEEPLLIEQIPVNLEDLFVFKLGGNEHVS